MKSSGSRKATTKTQPTPAVPSAVHFGQIVAIKRPDRVVLNTGRTTIEGRAAQHVDLAWVAAAVQVAPVSAAYAVPDETQPALVLAIYPGREHEAVRTEIRLEGTRVSLRAGKASVVLEKDDVRVRGKEIVSRAHEEHRIRGARIRFN